MNWGGGNSSAPVGLDGFMWYGDSPATLQPFGMPGDWTGRAPGLRVDGVDTPEPSAAALLLFGLCGLAALKRR